MTSSAYRIVQEALTNTLAARAGDQGLGDGSGRRTGRLELDVSDDGIGSEGSAAVGSGRGLAGMRERAAMLGGTVDAGPLPDGGFRVRARLPLEAGRRVTAYRVLLATIRRWSGRLPHDPRCGGH